MYRSQLQSVLSLLFNILTVSFYGGVHANSYASDHSDFTHAKLGPGWIMTLVGSIISFLALVPNIIDLSLPNAKRYAGGAGFNAPAMLSNLMGAAGMEKQAAGMSSNEPAAVR